MANKRKTQKLEGVRQRGDGSFRINYRDAEGLRHWETLTAKDEVFSIEDAASVRRQRLADVDRGIPVSSKANSVKFEELAADVVNDYLVNGYSSVDDIECRYRLHLLPVFGNRKASQITTDQIRGYIVRRMAEGAKHATINRELEAMRHAFLLAKKSTPPKVHSVPHFPMLKEDNVRQGFFERDRLEAICRHLPAHLAPVARFGYITGWRHREVVTLTLDHVDFDAGEVRLEPGETKNRKGRTFPMVDELRHLLRGIWPKGPSLPTMRLFRDPDGKPIHRFDKAWATACRLAGLPVRWVPLMKRLSPKDQSSPKIPVLYKRGPKKGQQVLVCRAAVYFHDFRRTAFRNLVRLGVPPKVARLSVGWLNIKTADRYDIPDKADLDVMRALYNAAAAGRLGANSGANRTNFGQNPEIAIESDLRKSTPDVGLSEVAPGGVEPPTSGLGNRCSILLSYGAVIEV
jgi:integrase